MKPVTLEPDDPSGPSHPKPLSVSQRRRDSKLSHCRRVPAGHGYRTDPAPPNRTSNKPPSSRPYPAAPAVRAKHVSNRRPYSPRDTGALQRLRWAPPCLAVRDRSQAAPDPAEDESGCRVLTEPGTELGSGPAPSTGGHRPDCSPRPAPSPRRRQQRGDPALRAPRPERVGLSSAAVYPRTAAGGGGEEGVARGRPTALRVLPCTALPPPAAAVGAAGGLRWADGKKEGREREKCERRYGRTYCIEVVNVNAVFEFSSIWSVCTGGLSRLFRGIITVVSKGALSKLRWKCSSTPQGILFPPALSPLL